MRPEALSGARSAQVRLAPYRLALRSPIRTAAGTIGHREGVIVELRDGPHVGRGEAAPLPGFSRETLAEARAELEAWRPGDPLPALPSARHGVEQALGALEASRRGWTLAEVLSPSPRRRVPVNALVAEPSAARRAVEAGFRTLKVKVGFAPDDDLRRVEAIRAAVGEGIALRLDANRGWREADARRVLERLEDLDVEFVEEPVGDLAAMARLRGPIPLAADESARDLADLERVVAMGAADLVVVKPMLVGGPVAALALIDRARVAGLGAIVTTSIDAAIGRDAALAVAAARDLPACGLDTGGLLAEDIGEGYPIVDGAAIVPLRRDA